MSDECPLCEMGVSKKVPVAVRVEPNVWTVWYIAPSLAEQLSKLLATSDDFVTETN